MTHQQYPRGYPIPSTGTLLFLVDHRGRAAAIINAVRDDFDRKGDQLPRVVALTIDDAVASFGHHLQASQTPPSPSYLPVTADDMARVARFYVSAVNTLKALRDKARARGELPPDYPDEVRFVHELIERLRASDAA